MAYRHQRTVACLSKEGVSLDIECIPLIATKCNALPIKINEGLLVPDGQQFTTKRVMPAVHANIPISYKGTLLKRLGVNVLLY